ncbi:MAG: arginine decarboxylase, partial [Planctomycetes bacterium]|nr:arginine decarboxylase [Planctomycetota bacterium]
VLSYVQYDKQDLIRRMRSRLEQAVRAGKVNMRESALLLRRYEEGLAAYTYLADDDLEVSAADPVAIPQPNAIGNVPGAGDVPAADASTLQGSELPPV